MIDQYPELRATKLIEVYPEFAPAGALAVRAIEHALPQVSAEYYGDLLDEAVLLIAADWLANHPYGMSLRLDGGGAPTRYATMLAELKMKIPNAGFMLT